MTDADRPSPPITFSIVVPVHDVRPYLAECLDSLLGQSFGDFEVLGIDDASTDGSSQLLDDYAARDPRVHVQHLADNVGLGRARNTGLERATGRYVLFVDSDDRLAPGALEAVAQRLTQLDGPDVLVFDYVRTLPDGGTTDDPRSTELVSGNPGPFRLTERPRFLELFPVVWNKAYRRTFLQAQNFAFPPGFYEDLPFTYPVLITAERIGTLDRVCYLYRQRVGAILRSADRRQLEFFVQFDRVFDFLNDHPEFAAWRLPLFDRLTRHAPWVLERDERISPELRSSFFAAASASFRRNRPPGFVPPSASARLKIALIERGNYRAFRLAQLGNLLARRTRRSRVHGRWPV